MTYYTDLACELRMRKCSEEQIVQVLETVKESTSASNSTPEEEFGSPKTYAASYKGSRSMSPGQRVVVPFGMIGLICVLVYAIWPDWFAIEIPVVKQFAGMIALIVLLIVGAIAGSIVDNRLPAGFTPPVGAKAE